MIKVCERYENSKFETKEILQSTVINFLLATLDESYKQSVRSRTKAKEILETLNQRNNMKTSSEILAFKVRFNQIKIQKTKIRRL